MAMNHSATTRCAHYMALQPAETGLRTTAACRTEHGQVISQSAAGTDNSHHAHNKQTIM